MQHTPLIAFTFAHDRDETKPLIRNLLKEQLQITSLVSPLEHQKHCETRTIVNAKLDRLNELIEREGHRLIGLHYASDVATLLRAREGKESSIERALRGQLGRRLGALPHLKWVFLSGDGSQEQAEALINAGVPLVIRSHNLINDDAAFRLAYFFYQTLGQGQNLGLACHKAVSEVRRDYVNKAKLTYEHEPPSGYGSDWPFAYHVNPHIASPMWWSVPHALGGEVAGIPASNLGALPDVPFVDMAPLGEEFGLLTSGRTRETRALYDILTAPHGPPFVILSGASRMGKTSFMRAQLGPVLQREFHVRYQSFQRDALTTLAHALSSSEDLSLARTWVELEGGEERALLQPQMITELMNEAQSSFRSNYRTDRADFSQFLRVIRAMWSRNELNAQENLLMRLGALFDQQSKMNQEEAEAEITPRDLRPLVVLLDQFEESFHIKDPLGSRRQQRFWQTLQQLSQNPDRPFRGGLIFCVDDAYCAQMLALMERYNLAHHHVHLSPLTRDHLERYLDQLRLHPKLRERFPLMIDERAPSVWSQLLEKTPPQLLGDHFQAMFRHLWMTQSQRPILVNVELIQEVFGSRSTLDELLLKRVRDFINLMRAQGDDDLSDLFALDFLHTITSASARAKAKLIDAELGSGIRSEAEDPFAPVMTESFEGSDSASVTRAPGPRVSTRHGSVEIEDLLRDYLNWGESLPEPWASRQRSIAGQSLWVLTQAIDLGLFRGRITAGTSLPSGVVTPVHPSLCDVIEAEWSTQLGASARVIERISDYASAQLTVPTQDVELARSAFSCMRLPTLEESELLLTSLGHLQDQDSRHHVSGLRDRMLIGAVCIGLVLTVGRCAQLERSQQELSASRARVDDQLKLLAADKALANESPDLSAALLSEVSESQLGSRWDELAISSLNTSLLKSRQVSNRGWRAVKLTAQSMAVSEVGGGVTLWSGSPLEPTHALNQPTHFDHDALGQRWVSFDSGLLLFWSLDAPQATQKRLEENEVRALHLNDEGTIAAVLTANGSVALHRSYKYPLKEFGGILSARVERTLLSPDRRSLLLIDERGGAQSISLSDERPELSIPAPRGVQLIDAAWIEGDTPSVVVAHHDPTSGRSFVSWHQRGREPLNLYQGAEQVRRLYPAARAALLALELSGSTRGGGEPDRTTHRVRVFDLSSPQSAPTLINSPTSPIERLVFDKLGRRLALLTDGATPTLTFMSLRERKMTRLTLSSETRPRELKISADGGSVFGLDAHQVTRWSAVDGRLISRYRQAEMSPVAMHELGGDLVIAFSDQLQRSRAALLTWPLEESRLSTPVSRPQEEVSQALWSQHELVIGDQRGELTIWSDPPLSQPKVRFKAHQGRVSALALSARGDNLISASSDGSVARWSLRDGKAVSRYQSHRAPVTALAVARRESSELIISGDERGMVSLEGLGATESWRAHRGPVRDLSISPSGELLVSLPRSVEGRGAIWQLGVQPVKLSDLPSGLLTVHWSKSERGEGLIGVTTSGQLKRWTTSGVVSDAVVSCHEQLRGAELKTATFSSSGEWMIGVTQRGGALLCHLERARAQVLTPPRGRLVMARFLEEPTAQSGAPTLLFGGGAGALWMWRAGRWVTLGQQHGAITQLEVSPQRGSVLSASSDLALHWAGPFNREALHSQLKQRVNVCLSPAERSELLAEPLIEAQRNAKRCVDSRR